MKPAWIFRLFLTGVIVVALFGCKKDKNNTEVTAPVAGKGGTATLRIIPVHTGLDIDSCMIYLKYNADTYPEKFDDSFKCKVEDGRPVATFTNLKRGQYYIYGYGWDIVRSQTVIGSRPYYITTNNTSYTVELETTMK